MFAGSTASTKAATIAAIAFAIREGPSAVNAACAFMLRGVADSDCSPHYLYPNLRVWFLG